MVMATQTVGFWLSIIRLFSIANHFTRNPALSHLVKIYTVIPPLITFIHKRYRISSIILSSLQSP